MKNYRIFVEKKPRFRVEAESLKRELNLNLNLQIEELRLLCVYDLFGFTDELVERCRYGVFGEVVTDTVTDAFDLADRPHLAVEFLPGQFDQRAASAVDCVRLVDPTADVRIRSSKLLVFDAGVSQEALAKIRHYYINAVESREKNLAVLSEQEQAEVRPVEVLDGFCAMPETEWGAFCKSRGLAMNADDLGEVVRYFREEGRDPYETELRILDTYWSDHCRHTTFTTELEGITVEESFLKSEIESSLALYLRIRRGLGREAKPVCLMDMATIGARVLRKRGLHFDSVIAATDELAVGALKYLHARGLRVPEEVNVIGCNNSELSICCEPELTTIDNRVEALCRTTIDSVMALLGGDAVKQKQLIKCHLVRRATTDF